MVILGLTLAVSIPFFLLRDSRTALSRDECNGYVATGQFFRVQLCCSLRDAPENVNNRPETYRVKRITRTA